MLCTVESVGRLTSPDLLRQPSTAQHPPVRPYSPRGFGAMKSLENTLFFFALAAASLTAVRNPAVAFAEKPARYQLLNHVSLQGSSRGNLTKPMDDGRGAAQLLPMIDEVF